MAGQVSDRRVRRLRRYWDKHASTYDEQIAGWERRLFPEGRRWVCSQASGDVLEVAIGSGRNLPHYPDDVRLTGIDLSPEMLKLARHRADRLGRQVDLRLGDAQDLDLPDASFDTVVCTLVLCGVPDDGGAMAEMRRVLRPGGRLLLLDHVMGEPWWVRALQWLMELYTRPFQDEHMRRRPLLHVQAQGFEIERHERSKRGVIEQLTARKPAAAGQIRPAAKQYDAPSERLWFVLSAGTEASTGRGRAPWPTTCWCSQAAAWRRPRPSSRL